MYRIISGNLKGKKITAPSNFNIRPTTDFAKEGLFNLINNEFDFDKLKVLDLFGGIGSITFEFISRNCNDLTIVENSFKHFQFIENQAIKLNIDSKINFIKQDVFKFLEHNELIFDLIFADPPFDFTLDKYNKLITNILEKNIISKNGYFILEHPTKINFEELQYFIKSKKYGNISFSFFNNNNFIK